MTYVVTDACIACKYTDCVEICPTDAFYEGPNFLVINPDECIDCNLCVAECPVGAIFDEDDLTAEQLPFLALNQQLSQQWSNISRAKAPLADAEHYRLMANKLDLLQIE